MYTTTRSTFVISTLIIFIFDLIYGDDAEKAASKKQWKRQENAFVIATNDAKEADEERRMAQIISKLQRLADERRQLQQRGNLRFKADLERQKAQLMEALGENNESGVFKLRTTTTAISIN
ncbi:conserved hypothetical protein [Plasmopara halstedii]|uniref:MAT1 centre domain-containing protein n=1 Tax=Plasmopara halstedii TaxID=4781 RepID=A0A0P1AIZ3_PLAHL|nr:conserved hypothetical protein [Plasmopara halstedii]CEG40712.1 conserved hypothetical protein [Plasmopara halstedii]|eukprot:XP_024577081.1 conserved hypothetical protein [Plasmopara halstedii]